MRSGRRAMRASLDAKLDRGRASCAASGSSETRQTGNGLPGASSRSKTFQVTSPSSLSGSSRYSAATACGWSATHHEHLAGNCTIVRRASWPLRPHLVMALKLLAARDGSESTDEHAHRRAPAVAFRCTGSTRMPPCRRSSAIAAVSLAGMQPRARNRARERRLEAVVHRHRLRLELARAPIAARHAGLRER